MRTLAILERLVAFDTVSAKPNLGLVAFVEDHLRQLGFRVTRIPDPQEDKAGLYAEIGPPGAGVLLSAHSDTVPVEGQDWTHDPFRLTAQDGRLYGRGTTDMKGFVAAMLSAAERASRLPLSEPLKLVLSYDEEIGCVGIGRMMDRLIPLMGRPRAAIVGEPTQMQVAIGHKGKQGFRAIVAGQAGHSALAPLHVNALNVAAGFVQALQSLQAELERDGPRDPAYAVPYSTVHVGYLAGGRALNIVPDRAEILFEIRALAEDDPEDLRHRAEAAAKAVCAAHGPAARIGIEPLAGYPGLAMAPDAPVAVWARELAGQGLTKVAFGTEAGCFDALGIPTVVCGPGSMEGQGHKPDEYITLDQIAACDAMLDRLLAGMVEAQARPRS
ncbi:MAG: acetylornithine deacetylase [Rubellimicrobium sp.]|nr:acetylornithine deacetylase [Rubellimicrobium sp.]